MKKWLEEYKVFFDIAASLIIGIAALMVSYASYTISKNQLELSELSYQPKFNISTAVVFDQKKQKYTEQVLEVHSSGGRPANLTYKVKSFLVLNDFDGVLEDPTYVPIYGYFPAKIDHQVVEGKLSTFRGHENNQLFHDLYVEFMSEKLEKKYGFVDLNVVHVVVIQYSDIDGENHTQYFKDRNLAAESEISHLLKLHDSIGVLDIGNLDADAVMEYALKKSTK